MNERLYQVCADVLVTAVQLTSESSLAAAGDLRQRLIGALDRMVSDGRRMGIADGDLAEARYALVAFIDEQIMRSDWAGRAEWMARPLQLELYRENTAGENFFVRLRALLRAGDRPVAVEIYYLCLVLGFQGAYRDGGEPQAVEKFTRAAHDQLRKVLPDPNRVSPHAKPKGSTRAVKTGWSLLLFVAASSVALILIVLVGLGWSAGFERDQLVEQLGRRDARASGSGSSLGARPAVSPGASDRAAFPGASDRAVSPGASDRAVSPGASDRAVSPGASDRAPSPRGGAADEPPLGTRRASVRPVTQP